MANEVLKIDANSRNTAGGLSNDANLEIVNFRVNPTSKGLIVENVNASGTSVDATQIDHAAFTPTTGRVMMMGAEADEESTNSVNEGDGGALRMSLRRALKTDLDTLLSGEDQTNSVMAVVIKPLGTSTYALSDDQSAAAEASSISKASSGTFFRFMATNIITADRYFQVFDSATLPANGTVPEHSWFVAAGGTASEAYDLGDYHTNGIVWCWSTTAGTKTIGGADGIAVVDYI